MVAKRPEAATIRLPLSFISCQHQMDDLFETTISCVFHPIFMYERPFTCQIRLIHINWPTTYSQSLELKLTSINDRISSNQRLQIFEMSTQRNVDVKTLISQQNRIKQLDSSWTQCVLSRYRKRHDTSQMKSEQCRIYSLSNLRPYYIQLFKQTTH